MIMLEKELSFLSTLSVAMFTKLVPSISIAAPFSMYILGLLNDGNVATGEGIAYF